MTSSGHTVPANHGKARAARAYREAARHSAYVRLAKIGLPIAGALGAAVFAGFTVFARPDLPDIAVDLTRTAVTDGKVVMANPRMSGFTKDERPYEMEAERAIQDITNSTEILLENIKARVPFSGDEAASIVAESALYNDQDQTLIINRPFTISSPDGLQAALQSAYVNIADGALVTTQVVDIRMKGTHIVADSLHVAEKGKVLVFENNVRLTIKPDAVNAANPAEAAGQNEGN